MLELFEFIWDELTDSDEPLMLKICLCVLVLCFVGLLGVGVFATIVFIHGG